MKYNLAIKRNGMLTHTTKLNLKDMLNARSLNKKVLYIPYDSIIIKIRTGKTNLWWKKLE